MADRCEFELSLTVGLRRLARWSSGRAMGGGSFAQVLCFARSPDRSDGWLSRSEFLARSPESFVSLVRRIDRGLSLLDEEVLSVDRSPNRIDGWLDRSGFLARSPKFFLWIVRWIVALGGCCVLRMVFLFVLSSSLVLCFEFFLSLSLRFARPGNELK